MSKDDLKKRAIWQDYSGRNASIAEHSFFHTFSVLFENTDFRIRSKPNEFNDIYVNIPLSEATTNEIYTPEKPIARHGVFPDYAIDNLVTQKTIYVEVKRQDGWVEGKKRSDGRGNAHERSCKFFTPGLLKILREKSNIQADALPFWTVFQGDITRDPCRVREITCWYDEYTSHYFFGRNAADSTSLIGHFDTQIKPLLL